MNGFIQTLKNKTKDKVIFPRTKTKAVTNDAGKDVDTLFSEVNNKIDTQTHTASQVTFADGKTFQQKYDSGELRGQQGPRGLQGPKGDAGSAGPQGPTGPKGDRGATGPQGIQGPKGDTGLRGPQGAAGTTGPQGPRGYNGADGLTTSIRVNGVVYTQSGGQISLPSYPTIGDQVTFSYNSYTKSLDIIPK